MSATAGERVREFFTDSEHRFPPALTRLILEYGVWLNVCTRVLATADFSRCIVAHDGLLYSANSAGQLEVFSRKKGSQSQISGLETSGCAIPSMAVDCKQGSLLLCDVSGQSVLSYSIGRRETTCFTVSVCDPVAITMSRGEVFVLNAGDQHGVVPRTDSVAVFSANTMNHLRTWNLEMCDSALFITGNDENDHLFMTQFNMKSVEIRHRQDGHQVGTIQVTGEPRGLALHHSLLYVAITDYRHDHFIGVCDTKTDVTCTPKWPAPGGVTICISGDQLFVTHHDMRHVSVFV